MKRKIYPHRPSIPEPRAHLLRETLAFVRAAKKCPGVVRIALVGSLTTDKALPKDADLLVTVAEDYDLPALATLGRRLKGGAGHINCGADIFLCNPEGRYLGRTCGYRECHPRAACHGQGCFDGTHLNNDLENLTLSSELILNPPLVLWPRVVRGREMPKDVEELLVRAFA
jgi:hypothetical protein